MPLYEYINDSGDVIELPRTIAKRDRAPKGYRRSIVPTRIGVCGSPIKEETLGQRMMKGYHDTECKQGSRFNTELPVKTIKRAWAEDL